MTKTQADRYNYASRGMIEVHPDPERAMSDGAQSLYPDQFGELMEQIAVIATAIGTRMVPPVAAGQGAGAAG